MILGFGVDLLGFASAGALPFPGGIAIVTQHIDNSPHLASNPSYPQTHPNLPKGKELVTLQLTSANHISPHLASPEGEGQMPLAFDYCL